MRPWASPPGPDGNLWFTEAAGNRIGRITPEGAVTEFSDGIRPESGLYDITAGPDGNLWFTEFDAYRIGRITPAGAVTEFSVGTRPKRSRYGITPGPRVITTGPDGNLWFTEADGHRIGRITPAGLVTMFSAGLGQGSPCGIAGGADGNVWFTEGEGNRIGRISPSGAVSVFRGPSPYVHHETSEGFWYSRCGISPGPDGNMWFTEWEADRIGRITPTGVVSEYPPTAAIGAVRLRAPASAGVRLRCPSGAARACRGTLRLISIESFPEQRVGVRRFTVAPGLQTEVVVPLWAAGRRSLRAERQLVLDVVLVPSAHSLAGSVERRALLRLPRAPAVAG